MSDRERWIIYPLLFLALGASLHDKYAPASKVRTHKLIVYNEDDQPIIAIGPTKDGDGEVRVGRGDQKLDLVLGHEDTSSSLFIETPTATGTARRAVLGNLRNYGPSRPLGWLGDIPLLSPTQLQSRTQPESPVGPPAEQKK